MNEEKELVIALVDAEQEAVEAVNAIMQRNGLPCYLMEMILGKIYQQLKDAKASELAEAKIRAQNAQVDKAGNKSSETAASGECARAEGNTTIAYGSTGEESCNG